MESRGSVAAVKRRCLSRRHPLLHDPGTARVAFPFESARDDGSRRRADRCAHETARRGERRRIVVAIVEMQHDAIPQRPRAGNAGDAAHRRAVEVADPHADGVIARKADRPGVAKIGRRPGLHRGRKRHLKHRADAEGFGARVRIGEHIGDELPIFRSSDAVRGRVRRHRQAQRAKLTAARDGRVCLHEFPETHFAASERQSKPVVRRGCGRDA